MSTALITASKLKTLAGYAFSRGRAYVDEGRVLDCRDDGTTIEGIVHGQSAYAVRVVAHGTQLTSDCTCPVGHSFCKHAVALALFRLEQDAQPQLARQKLEREAWSQSNQPTFATRKDLETWADAHRVRHVLEQSAEQLCAELPGELVARYGLRYALGRMSLREVGSREGAARYLAARGIDASVAGAAYAVVTRAAASVESGMAEEVARVEPAALPPVLAKLWVKLIALRDTIREVAVPRSRDERKGGSLGYDRERPGLVWRELDRVFRPSTGFASYGSFGVQSRIEFPGGGAPVMACNCEAKVVPCAHLLAAVDTALDRLGDSGAHAELVPVAEELLRPGWSRALEELALLEARAVKPAVAIEVWWSIELELGQWMLVPIVKKALKKGGFTTGSRMAAGKLLDEHRAALGEDDLRIAEFLASWAPATRAAGTYPVRAFAALIGHPRVLHEHGDDRFTVARAPLGFIASQVGDQIRVAPALDGAGLDARLIAPLLRVFAAGEPVIAIDPERTRCTLVDVSDDARKLFAVLERHGELFPPESHPQLLERLATFEARVPLHVPRELKGREHAAKLTTVCRLRLAPDGALELDLLVRPGPGAPLFHPGAGPIDVLLARDGERGYVRRDLTTELARAHAAIASLPLADAIEGPPSVYRIAELDPALALVAALQDPPPGVEAEWLDAKPVVYSAPSVAQLRVTIERKQDWFGITGDLKIEAGRVELAILLDAARRQQRFVKVGEHRWVELSATLRDRLTGISDRAFIGKTRASPGSAGARSDAERRAVSIELSPGAVPAVAALEALGASVKLAPEWELLAERLAASLALKVKPPANLKATLRDYQAEGHAWLSRVAAWGAGAVLADDMGLGKTVQAIAVLLDRAKLGPTLVLAPTSVALNWVAELARFAPDLKPIVYAEADRAAVLGKLKKKDVLIVSYGLLVRDAAALAVPRFGTLVIDEAQALKNPTTRRAKAARGLQADFRIALSGTPFENHLGELWSLFATVFPGLLGSWDQFRDRFATPIEKGKDPEARMALSRVLAPFLLRRTKAEVARELPSRTEIEVPVALSNEEWTMYEDARLAAIAELGKSSKALQDQQRRFQVLAALTRLRMLACHPRLHDAKTEVGSSKLRRLLELVDELRSEGHRALVFSQFTSHLALVREELDRAGYVSLYLDGSTPMQQRAKLVERFQAGEGEIFLISLKAGGTGINLTAADYVIHLDPWWNPAVEDQATDRAHRIGQTKPVTVYRLVARGTIEEQILAMHRDKRALVAGILEGTDVAARLTTKDLLALLETGERGGDDAADDDDGERRASVH